MTSVLSGPDNKLSGVTREDHGHNCDIGDVKTDKYDRVLPPIKLYYFHRYQIRGPITKDLLNDLF